MASKREGRVPRGVQYCCVCSSFRGKIIDGRKVSLHRFPANKKENCVWQKRVKLVMVAGFHISKHSLLCSEHFAGKEGPKKPHVTLPSLFANKEFTTTAIYDNFEDSCVAETGCEGDIPRGKDEQLPTPETGTGNKKPKTKVCWELSGSFGSKKDPEKVSAVLRAGGTDDPALIALTQKIHDPEPQSNPNEPFVYREPFCDRKPVFLSKASLDPEPRYLCGADAEEEYRIELNPEWQSGDDSSKRYMPCATESDNSAITEQEISDGLSAGCVTQETVVAVTDTDCYTAWPLAKTCSSIIGTSFAGENMCTALSTEAVIQQLSSDVKVEKVCTKQSSIKLSGHQRRNASPGESTCIAEFSAKGNVHKLLLHAEEQKVSTQNSSSGLCDQEIAAADISSSTTNVGAAATGSTEIRPMVAASREAVFCRKSFSEDGSRKLTMVPPDGGKSSTSNTHVGQKVIILTPPGGEQSSTGQSLRQARKIILLTPVGKNKTALCKSSDFSSQKLHSISTGIAGNSDISSKQMISLLNCDVRDQGFFGHTSAEFSNQRINLLAGGRENLSSQSPPKFFSQKLFPTTTTAAENLGMSSGQTVSLLNAGVTQKAHAGQMSQQCRGGRIILSAPGGGGKTLGQSSGNCGNKKLVSVMTATAENSGVSGTLKTSVLNPAVRQKADIKQISAERGGEIPSADSILQGFTDMPKKHYTGNSCFICKYCQTTIAGQQKLVTHLLACTERKSVGLSPPDSKNVTHLASSSPATVKDEGLVRPESSGPTAVKDKPAHPVSSSPSGLENETTCPALSSPGGLENETTCPVSSSPSGLENETTCPALSSPSGFENKTTCPALSSPPALKDKDPACPASPHPTSLKPNNPALQISSRPTVVKGRKSVSPKVTLVWILPKPPEQQAKTVVTHDIGTCTQRKRHKIKELVELPYRCEHCFSRHKELGHLRIHMRIHHKPETNLCPNCGKQFSSLRAFETHVRRHEMERPFVCDQCPMTFKYISALRSHQRVHAGVKLFQCEMCAKKFSASTHLKRHRLTHTNDGPIKCPECPATFLVPSSFKIHVRVHTGERPYPCRFCHKAFRDTSSLNLHTRIHTRQKPFRCETCAASFQHSGALKQHLQAEHEASSPFICDHCGVPFGSRATLKRHLQFHSRFMDRTHTPEIDIQLSEKPLPCQS